jgi:transposase InsO family protein
MKTDHSSAAEPANSPGATQSATGKEGQEAAAKAPETTGLTAAQQAQALERWRLIQPVLELKNGHRQAAFAGLAATAGKSERMLRVYVERYEGKAKGKYTGMAGLVALADAPRADKGVPKKVNEASRLLIESLELSGDESSLRSNYEDGYNLERDTLWRKHKWGDPLTEEEAERLKPEWYDEETFLLKPEGVPAEISFETYRTVARGIHPGKRLLARGERTRYENTQVPFSRRSYQRILLMDYVQMDHRQLDIFCLFWDGRKWEVIRPWITVGMDMRSRRILSCRVVRTPSSDSVASALREIFTAHGRPKNLCFDNGPDFKGDYVTGIASSVGTNVIWSIPRRARSKSIEPNFIRFKRMERGMRGCYCGHKPGARPEVMDQIMVEVKAWMAGKRKERPLPTFEEIQELYRDVVVPDINAKKLVADGMEFIRPEGPVFVSPNECWAELAPLSRREEVPMAAIQMLMRERRPVTVRAAQIEIQINKRSYFYMPAIEYGAGALYRWNDKKVDLWVDRQDLGTVIAQREEVVDGKTVNAMVVCHCMELRGMGEDQFKHDEKLRRALLREEVEAVTKAQNARRPLTYVEAVRKRVDGYSFPEPERPRVIVALSEQQQMAAAIAAGENRGPVTPAKLEVVKHEAVDPDEGRLDFWGSPKKGD